MKRRIYKFIFFGLMHWKFNGLFDPEIRKCVIIVIPHTSWHDFYIGLFSRGIVGLDMHFVGKKELFRFPFGYYFRWMGGTPIDRWGGLDKVDSIAAMFKNRNIFRLAISPEGTRKKVAELKTGFYFIALKANVPIVPVAFDYANKEVKFAEPFIPTGNYQADIKMMLQHFKGVKGRKTEYSFEP